MKSIKKIKGVLYILLVAFLMQTVCFAATTEVHTVGVYGSNTVKFTSQSFESNGNILLTANVYNHSFNTPSNINQCLIQVQQEISTNYWVNVRTSVDSLNSLDDTHIYHKYSVAKGTYRVVITSKSPVTLNGHIVGN